MIEIISNRHSFAEYLECVSDLMGRGTPTSEETFYGRIHFKQDNVKIYVDIIDNKIVATGSLLIEHKLRYTEPKTYIEDIAVHPDYRGRGLGKNMIRHLISESRRLNAYKIVLTCTDELIPYYKSLGFEKDVNFMVN